MAKVKDKLAAPATLTLNLFGAGMSPLHRAGLGGLACTLKYIEQAYADDALDDKDVPGGPWHNGKFPWTITPHSVTVDFGQADHAGAFLKRLFKIAFGIKDDLIFLPGQYGYRSEPTKGVRAELQQALLLTFLQHGKTRGLAKEPSIEQAEVDGQLMPPIQYRKCTGYKHQDGWEELAGKKTLTAKAVEVVGPLNPGAVVRHVAFSADTRIEETPERILPLYFAIVGCLALSVNRGVGVLVVPDVADLTSFVVVRPLMTPRSPAECRVASAGDAALQAQVRVMVKGKLHAHDLPGANAMTFMPTPWASQQKSRTATIHVPPGDERRLSRFADALQSLEPRVKTYVQKESTGKGKHKRTTETTGRFWADSVVRPLVADNLALDRPWYAGFVRLMTAIDQSNRPVRDKLSFERKGLHTMTANRSMFDTDGESVVIRAVHEALRSRYGRIADENKKNPAARKARWAGEYDRWRLAFAGAKTADQFRTALCDLFSRGGSNSALRESWTSLLPLLKDTRWQLTRDLALLALPSYAGAEATNGDANEPLAPTK